MTITPVYWTEAEPERLARDLADVAGVAPDLTFRPPGPTGDGDGDGQGMWVGRLPVWPMDRPEPDGLDVIVPSGLGCAVVCSAAHPMIPPQVRPLDPEPQMLERSQHRWHVTPAGGLCLMQSTGDWDPSDSVADLLVKAAAWRIEYALMKAGMIGSMSLNGIASDGAFDHLVTRASKARGSAEVFEDAAETP